MALLTRGKFKYLFLSFRLSNPTQTLRISLLKEVRDKMLVFNILELDRRSAGEIRGYTLSQFVGATKPTCHNILKSWSFLWTIAQGSRRVSQRLRELLAMTNPMQLWKRVGEAPLCLPSKISSHCHPGLLCHSHHLLLVDSTRTSVLQSMAKY